MLRHIAAAVLAAGLLSPSAQAQETAAPTRTYVHAGALLDRPGQAPAWT